MNTITKLECRIRRLEILIGAMDAFNTNAVINQIQRTVARHFNVPLTVFTRRLTGTDPGSWPKQVSIKLARELLRLNAGQLARILDVDQGMISWHTHRADDYIETDATARATYEQLKTQLAEDLGLNPQP